jgi:hypothetical protein
MSWAIVIAGLLYLTLTIVTFCKLEEQHIFVVKFLSVQLVRDLAITVIGIICAISNAGGDGQEDDRFIAACLAINSFLNFASFWILALKISNAAHETNGLFSGEIDNIEIKRRFIWQRNGGLFIALVVEVCMALEPIQNKFAVVMILRVSLIGLQLITAYLLRRAEKSMLELQKWTQLEKVSISFTSVKGIYAIILCNIVFILLIFALWNATRASKQVICITLAVFQITSVALMYVILIQISKKDYFSMLV